MNHLANQIAVLVVTHHARQDQVRTLAARSLRTMAKRAEFRECPSPLIGIARGWDSGPTREMPSRGASQEKVA